MGSAAIDNLAAGAAQDVTAKADIPAGAWNINDQGEGTAELTVKVTQDDGTVLDTGTVTAKRVYDAQAISILSGVSGGDGESFSMEVGDVTDLQPGLSGSAAGDAQVVWTASSDPDNLTITGDGNIMAQKNGTYTLTGRILPASDLVADANWDALVPENLIKTVSATVTVGSPTDSTDTSSGTTKPMDTPTPSVTSSPTPSPSESTNSTGGNTSSLQRTRHRRLPETQIRQAGTQRRSLRRIRRLRIPEIQHLSNRRIRLRWPREQLPGEREYNIRESVKYYRKRTHHEYRKRHVLYTQQSADRR